MAKGNKYGTLDPKNRTQSSRQRKEVSLVTDNEPVDIGEGYGMLIFTNLTGI